MAAVAHNPAFAKKVGVSQAVGKDFNTADKGKTFKRGGDMKKMAEGGKADMAQDKTMIKKAMKQHDMQEHKGGKGTKLKLAKGGMFRKSANGVAKKGLTKAMMPKMPKMSKGGRTC